MIANLWGLVTGVDRKVGFILIFVMLLLHAGMTLLFKLVFFSYSGISDSIVIPTEAPAATEAPTEAATTIAPSTGALL